MSTCEEFSLDSDNDDGTHLPISADIEFCLSFRAIFMRSVGDMDSSNESAVSFVGSHCNWIYSSRLPPFASSINIKRHGTLGPNV